MLKIILFFCLFSLTMNTNLMAMEKTPEQKADKEEYQKLITQADEAINCKEYTKSLKKLSDAQIFAESKQWDYELAEIKLKIGRVYTNLSNYGEALSYYNESLAIIKKQENLNKETAAILNNIGNLYGKEKNYIEAIKHYKKAYMLAKDDNLAFLNVLLAINIAKSYNNIYESNYAIEYLEEVKKQLKETDFEEQWKVTYAESLFLKGEITRAKKIAEQLLEVTDEANNVECYVCVVELLSKIYDRQGNIDLAIMYSKKGLRNNEDLDGIIDLYEKLSTLYFRKDKYITARKYRDSVIFAKDSLNNLINRSLYESNKVKFKVREYQNQLVLNKEKQKAERNIFIVIIIAGLIVFYAIYRGLQNRIIKQKQTQKIVNLELEKEKNEHLLLERKVEALKNKSRLKQERLKNKIAQKNRELSASALYHSGRNELIEKVISSLNTIPAVSENKEVKTYINSLKSHIKTDAEWKEFISHFEKVNPGFLKKMKEKHPKLTKKDIRFLCYLYMNLNTKEICAIFNITQEALWKRKQRLSEKIQLPKKASLYDYIISIKNR